MTALQIADGKPTTTKKGGKGTGLKRITTLNEHGC